MKTRILNGLGWLGVLSILVAYSTNVFGILTSSSLIYLLMNFLGSTLILIETLNKRDYQPALLNLVWAIVAVIMLVRIIYG